jgi:hypothetical protein
VLLSLFHVVQSAASGKHRAKKPKKQKKKKQTKKKKGLHVLVPEPR